ncbi:MAG: dihydroorotase [Bdellovibrionota bacterium]
MKVLIQNAHVIDPSQNLDGKKDILISDGKISAFAVPNSYSANVDKTIDAKGNYVAPGLIDLHVHFREPGGEHKETIATGSKSAVAGGFTSVFAMPNTYPVNDNTDTTYLMFDKAREVNLCRVYPVGAVTKNLQSQEMAPLRELRRAGCLVFSDDGRPVSNTELLRKALVEIREMNSVMIEHCEEIAMANYVTIHDGAVSKEMGITGITPSSETSDVVRLIALAMETGCRVHLAHLSCEDSVKFLRMFKKNVKLTGEVTPHHLVLTHEDVRYLGTHGKMYPPLRRQQDCDALIEGLNDGTIDAVATDHAPHAPNEKGLPFERAPNGVIGLETALPIMLRLVAEKKISLTRVIEVMSIKPAKIASLEVGLKVGNRADMVVFSDQEIRDFSKEKFQSKSINHPFTKYKGRGRVHMTLVDGEVKFTDGSL